MGKIKLILYLEDICFFKSKTIITLCFTKGNNIIKWKQWKM